MAIMAFPELIFLFFIYVLSIKRNICFKYILCLQLFICNV